MRNSAIVLTVPLLVLLATGEASAHAFLDHAEPRVGNKVDAAPREVTLWFTQKLEPAFSTITVTKAAGQRVDTGKTRVNGNQMAISLRGDHREIHPVPSRLSSVHAHTRDCNCPFHVAR